MNIANGWFLLIAAAAGAAVSAIVISSSRRRDRLAANDLEHTTQLKSWENEGGNLPPTAAAPVLP